MVRVKKKVRVGVIGAGFARKAHVPGFLAWPNVEVVAICSGHRANAEATAQEYGIPHVVSGYEEMVRMEEVDLIDVVTPPYLHYPMVMAALEAGKHVLCEKPMALNAGESREMYRRAEDAGIVHLINHELRFNPTQMRMKELIDEGFIGRLRHVILTTITSFQSDASSPWTWWSQREKGGGRLGAGGSHHIDQLRWWFGEIDGVCSRGRTFVDKRPLPNSSETRVVDSDDFASLLIHFANGAEGIVCLSSVASHIRGNRVEAYGDQGSLLLDAEGMLWGAREGEKEFRNLSLPDPMASVDSVAANVWTRSFAHLAKHIVDAIASGGTVQRGATFYDGLRCQQVLDATRQSWDEGQWVDIGGEPA